MIKKFRASQKKRSSPSDSKQYSSTSMPKEKKPIALSTDSSQDSVLEINGDDHKIGSFNRGDKAHSIVSHKLVNGKPLLEVKWLKRSTGVQPKNSDHPASSIRLFDPILLLNYYEEYFEKSESNKSTNYFLFNN